MPSQSRSEAGLVIAVCVVSELADYAKQFNVMR